MKNTFLDIHNMLVAQMELMSDPDCKPEDIKKATAMAQLGMVAVKNGQLMLRADQLYSNDSITEKRLFIGKDDYDKK